MPGGYKVRLGDGSEIGPLDLAAVKEWRAKGLLQGSSPVLAPGSKRWKTLSEVVQGGKSQGVSSSPPLSPRPAPREARTGRPARRSSGIPKALFLGLGLAAASGAGVAGYFFFFPESAQEHQIREAATADRSVSDDSLGWHLNLPRGWLLLKKDQTLVPSPPEAKLVLAEARTGTFAFLFTETSPDGVATLDQYLDRIMERRRKTAGPLSELSRSDSTVSGLKAREVQATGAGEGGPRTERLVVWNDGWVYFALESFSPSPGFGEKTKELLAAFQTNGALDLRLKTAVRTATAEVPFLNDKSAQVLMSRSSAKVLEPDQIFRRSVTALAREIPTWKGGDLRDISDLMSATYAVLAAHDRGRLASYFDAVRAGKPTSAQEDKDMCRAMKDAVLRLQAPRRARLQALYEKAILAQPGA